MIDIYKMVNSNLIEIQDFEPDCWVNIYNPNPLEYVELENMSEDFNIPLDFFSHPFDIDERARIEIEDDVLLLIIKIPYLDKDNVETPYITIPLGIIVTNDMIFTVCSKKNKVITSFLTEKVKNFSISNRLDFVLKILSKTTLLFLNDLKNINKDSLLIEKDLHLSIKNEDIMSLLNLEKSLVYFTTALKSNEIMMERLFRTKYIKHNSDEEELLEDIIIENKQAIEMANIYSNILHVLMTTFASVISNNLNIIMKFLASLSLLMMIPTLVASVYGMNIPLPFQNHPHAFIIVAAISIILMLIGIYIFLKRKFF